MANAALLTTSGATIAQATESVLAFAARRAHGTGLRQVRAMQTVTAVEPSGRYRLQLKVIAPVTSGDAAPLRVLVITQPVPPALREQTERGGRFPRLSGTVVPAHCAGSGCLHSR